MNVELGVEVGYRVRFDDRTDPPPTDRTRLLFMTDGMMVRETLTDPLLSSYSLIIVDEAHECSVPSDLLLGLLRRLLSRRRDLRVVVQSATLAVEDFRAFFAGVGGGCGVIAVEGRQWPVDLYYAKSPVKDYVRAAVETVLHLHRTQPNGDVLIFMTGREEVDDVVAALREYNTKSVHPHLSNTSGMPCSPLRAHSSLPLSL